ncbi:MAG: glycine--tRNA ligase subunit beta [Blastomonas fulva]|uniref:glycine--tRNA ligase subunit beta n=1 Tax=Blastomonas fulva TaxID=1550728 RepID=UPI0040338A0B
MPQLLLEIFSEEIPARMQQGAARDLERIVSDRLKAAGLTWDALTTYAGPRRLTLVIDGLPAATPDREEEVKGPKASAPEQALEGFLRKTGLTRDQLTERDGVLYAVLSSKGRATTDLVAETVDQVIRTFPWPKSMRWGTASPTTESLRWVRPLQGIIALLGGYVVPCEVDGLVAGDSTVGHRFHHKGAVTISGVEEYASALRAAHVIVDHDERASIIRDGASKAARDAGYVLVEDEGLVIENAGLTEWPVPLLGRYDPAFLEVPPEVIQLTTRINQKYFVVRDAAGALAPAFVCTANISAHDGGKAIVAGNEKVLAARLSDARFFWELDQKKTLEQHAEKLQNIVFHEKLGTVADKVERVAKLARWLCEEGIVKGDAALAEQAARLCKADLVTEMVGEFPELQGLMGGYYAAKEGLDPQVAAAIHDHYKPVGQGDDVPTAPVTVAVSLADKLDTIFSFFAIYDVPTGSKDPFALRRAALGVLRLVEAVSIQLPLEKAFLANHFHWLVGLAAYWANRRSIPLPEFEVAISDFDGFRSQVQETLWHQVDQNYANEFWKESRTRDPNAVSAAIDFFIDRLKVQQRQAGVRHDLIDAVFALGGDDNSSRLLARVHALQAFVETGEGGNLLAGYKRAANILKKEDVSGSPAQAGAHLPAGETPDGEEMDSRLRGRPEEGTGSVLSYTPEPAEAALIAALDAAEPRAIAAIEAEDFEGAMAALAVLRAPIDAFFDDVTVNDADPDKRTARLNLLARFRAAVHRVADFSKIEG